MGTDFFKSPRLGVLGGGQLGRMLLQDAINLDINISVLDPDPAAPCRHLVSHFETGSFKDYDTVYRFGKTVDILTVEIEHVNVDALEALEKEGVLVRPSSKILRLVQDKGDQKIFYRTHGIPTAEFHLINNKAELPNHISLLPVMQKLRKGGYDGKGVTPIRSTKDFDNAFTEASVLEKMVDFSKEIAVIVARNADGQCVSYPAVEMQFNPEANLVELLFCPAAITTEQEQKAEAIARKLADSLSLEGVLAVEMFITKDGNILVNEMAPRPHNSGHATIEANVTSQYEQHLRAILNLPLGDTKLLTPAAMVNILGEKGAEGPVNYEGMNHCLSLSGVHIHLYGKEKTKPFRKMGHVTVCDADLTSAIQKANIVRETLKAKS
jgi:5-(carboxyamino)imidazole ribonucleotide synthase